MGLRRKCCCDCEYFKDNFDRSGDLGSGWSVRSGVWILDSNTLKCLSNNAIIDCTAHNPANSLEYVVQVKIRGNAAGQQLRIYVNNRSQFVEVEYGGVFGGSGRLRIWDGSTLKGSVEAPGAAIGGSSVTVQVCVGNGIVTASIGTSIVHIPLTATSDVVSLGTGGGSTGVFFDDFSISYHNNHLRNCTSCSSVCGYVVDDFDRAALTSDWSGSGWSISGGVVSASSGTLMHTSVNGGDTVNEMWMQVVINSMAAGSHLDLLTNNGSDVVRLSLNAGIPAFEIGINGTSVYSGAAPAFPATAIVCRLKDIVGTSGSIGAYWAPTSVVSSPLFGIAAGGGVVAVDSVYASRASCSYCALCSTCKQGRVTKEMLVSIRGTTFAGGLFNGDWILQHQDPALLDCSIFGGAGIISPCDYSIAIPGGFCIRLRFLVYYIAWVVFGTNCCITSVPDGGPLIYTLIQTDPFDCENLHALNIPISGYATDGTCTITSQ